MHRVNAANRDRYERELELLFKARKSVFVDEMGWRLRVQGGLEIDEYDDDLANYVIGFSGIGDVAMSIRFRPTDDRSLMTDHFAHVLPFCPTSIMDGKTWEVSRGFCRELSRKPASMRRKAACMVTPLEVALQAGANRVVGFSDVRMLTFFIGIGWRLEMLGEPVSYGEGTGFAFQVQVNEASVAELRQRWGLPTPAHLFLRPEELEGMAPLQRASQLVMRDPALEALLPVCEPQRRPHQETRPTRSDRGINSNRLHQGARRVNQSLARTS
jgi:acyl homoserine lactone synthase